MKVLVNCYSMPLAKEGAGGAGKYLQALLPNLAKKVDLTIVASSRNKEEYSYDGASTIIPYANTGDALKGVLTNQDIYYNPTNGMSVVDIGVDVPVVSMVHDLQHNCMPNFFSREAFDGRNRDYGFQLSRSDAVVAISNWEKENFKKYFSAEHSNVIYHSSYLYDSVGMNGDALSLDWDEFYLYPAVGWPHKNQARLIEAVYLANQYKSADINLVLTGIVDHHDSNDLWKKVLELYPTVNVKMLGHVTDEQLAWLMMNAKGMFFPSLYEGFGIPLIDAMNYELPVLCSNTTCVSEVTQGKVEYFRNPENSSSMAEDIIRFDDQISSSDYSIGEAKSVATSYSTDRMVEELVSFFKETISRKKNGEISLSYCTKNADLNIPTEKVSLIYMLNEVDEHSPAETISTLCSIVDTNPLIDRAIVIVPDTLIGQTFHNEYIELASANNIGVVLSKNSRQGFEKAMMESVIYFVNTEYFILTKDLAEHAEYKKNYRFGVSYMDHFSDVFSYDFMGEKANGLMYVDVPNDEAKSIKKFLEIKSGGFSEFVEHYSNRLLRTSVCRERGAPGSLSLLSHDCSKLNKIVG